MSEDRQITCNGCGCLEGELHEDGCECEPCPLCGGVLVSCGCKDLDDDTFELVMKKNGRVPFIDYPQYCVKCGRNYPVLWGIPDEEWKRYIEPSMRDQIICKECFFKIKHLIDTRTFGVKGWKKTVWQRIMIAADHNFGLFLTPEMVQKIGNDFEARSRAEHDDEDEQTWRAADERGADAEAQTE